MKKEETVATVTPLLAVTFNHESDSTPECLGLTQERAKEIENEVEASAEKTDTRSRHIENILNTYTNPKELVWALFIGSNEEEVAATTSAEEGLSDAGIADDMPGF